MQSPFYHIYCQKFIQLKIFVYEILIIYFTLGSSKLLSYNIKSTPKKFEFNPLSSWNVGHEYEFVYIIFDV